MERTSPRCACCLHGFAALLVIATWVLLLAGGLVTSTKSGDAVPEWWFVPVAFGKVLPALPGKVTVEQSHRLVASTVGLFTLLLSIGVFRSGLGRGVKRLAAAMIAVVVVQGCLGGFRVERVLWPTAVAVVHACLAQAFFCMTVAMAIVTSRSWMEARPLGQTSSVSRWGTLATAAVFLQLVLGAFFRHTRIGLWAHAGFAVLVAMVVLGAVVVALGSFRGVRLIARPAFALLALLAVQVGLGIGTWWALANGYTHSIDAQRIDLAVVTSHLAFGAALLASALALTMSARRLGARGQEPVRRAAKAEVIA